MTKWNIYWPGEMRYLVSLRAFPADLVLLFSHPCILAFLLWLIIARYRTIVTYRSSLAVCSSSFFCTTLPPFTEKDTAKVWTAWITLVIVSWKTSWKYLSLQFHTKFINMTQWNHFVTQRSVTLEIGKITAKIISKTIIDYTKTRSFSRCFYTACKVNPRVQC